jgi:poly(3-hydroxybutyrate) depolymerase
MRFHAKPASVFILAAAFDWSAAAWGQRPAAGEPTKQEPKSGTAARDSRPGGGQFGRGGFSFEQIAERHDADKNGKVTREEWQGPSQVFDRMDRNGDGAISNHDFEGRGPGGSGGGQGEQGGKAETVQWHSSVDNAPLFGTLVRPKGFDPTGKDVPLCLWFNGSSGDLAVNQFWAEQLNVHGWLGLVVAGREWDLMQKYGSRYRWSMAYLNHPDPAIGPGAQDVLDGVDWATANYPVDANRIYVMGGSLGGRGAYMIGLTYPDRFAGIAPMHPAVDQFELDIRTEPTRASYPARIAIAQGLPGSGPVSDTLRSVQSARFLIENAYNLPVFQGHGLVDQTAANNLEFGPYMHGKHILFDETFDGVYSASASYAKAPCASPDTKYYFGHTPTLSELHRMAPDGYPFAWMMTEVPHKLDRPWFAGAPAGEAMGVEDPLHPGQLLGAFQFLSRFERNTSPDTVVYKSYLDIHRKAYWLEIDISTPWRNKPGAIRARRNSKDNALKIEMARVAAATIGLEAAKLTLAPGAALTVRMARLDEPVFDPALKAPDEPLAPRLILRGDFSGIKKLQVERDGAELSGAYFKLAQDRIEIFPYPIKTSALLELRVVP